ncbi:hypothetical protein [Phyllobacterium sp. YR531]|uniref:hypothetical protein n=1 Tax=Phyllobacterium sp. YR531 TaxID=1144343 RepID=UPI00026FBAE7|nr:hypothetical protein [Phyllobacterium sp. YR531]EJN04267.1 hypothetical protein PMI41_01906 [Phyllobacterium sp. YR531]
MRDAAIFLYDKTGIAARPWAEAGIECWCVDTQHSIRRDRKEGLINFVWGDARSWRPPAGLNIVFVGSMSPCTDVTLAGARDFEKKGGILLRDAIELFEAGRQCAAWSGAPYFCENPVGVLSGLPHIGKPDYYIHPCHYAGYADDPAEDAYTKKTGLWVGNGFVLPEKKPVDPLLGSKMWLMAPSSDRADRRSATPAGLSKALFLFNAPERYRRLAA